MITHILLGLILLALVGIGFMVFIIGGATPCSEEGILVGVLVTAILSAPADGAAKDEGIPHGRNKAP